MLCTGLHISHIQTAQSSRVEPHHTDQTELLPSAPLTTLPIVNSFAQFLDCPEVWSSLGRNHDFFASLRIAPGSRWPLIYHEAAEPTDFNPTSISGWKEKGDQRVAFLVTTERGLIDLSDADAAGAGTQRVPAAAFAIITCATRNLCQTLVAGTSGALAKATGPLSLVSTSGC